jgi:hypothetical protein
MWNVSPRRPARTESIIASIGVWSNGVMTMATHLGRRYEFLDLKFIMAGGAQIIIQINDPQVARRYDASFRSATGIRC